MVIKILNYFIYDTALTVLFNSIFKNFSIEQENNYCSFRLGCFNFILNTTSWDDACKIIADPVLLESTIIPDNDEKTLFNMQQFIKDAYNLDSIIKR